MQCLGRPFQLGMLYDCREDRIVPGITLWDSALLNAALSEKSQPSSQFEVIAEETTNDKLFALNISANLSLSFMSGLVNVSGAAEYLNDQKSSKNQSRVTLRYSCTSRFKQLTMEQLAVDKIQHPEIFEKGMATHVVTGVLYGGEAFFVFDREVSKEENYRDVRGNMEVLIKAIPGITEIKGGASLQMKDQNKIESEKFQCKFYGDIILHENPSTFSDAVRVYKNLPQQFGMSGMNTVPKKVWLYPLNKLDSKAAKMVREISTSLLTQTQQCMAFLQNVEMQTNDLSKSEVFDYFTGFRSQISQFQERVAEFKLGFTKQLSTLLPLVRGGGSEERELANILTHMQKSPFSRESITAWLDGKEGDVRALSQYLTIIKKTKGNLNIEYKNRLYACICGEFIHVVAQLPAQ